MRSSCPLALWSKEGLEMFGEFQNFSPNFKICMLFSLFWEKPNFQLKCTAWRWRHKGNLMTNFSDTTNSEYVIGFLNFWRKHWETDPIYRFPFFTFFLAFEDPLADNHCRRWLWLITIWIGNIFHQKIGIPTSSWIKFVSKEWLRK